MFTPADVAADSDKVVWWQCPKGHDYEMAVRDRTAKPAGWCPVCDVEIQRRLEKDAARVMGLHAQQFAEAVRLLHDAGLVTLVPGGDGGIQMALTAEGGAAVDALDGSPGEPPQSI